MGRAWRRSPPRNALPSERIAPSGATADDLDLCILALRLRQIPKFVVTSRFLPCNLLIARVRKGRLRELVWVGGGVTAPVAWASGPSVLASRGLWGRRCRGTRGPARSRERPWVCRSVHRSAKMASRRRLGALVYTVAPLRADVGTQRCTQIGENGLSAQPPPACRVRPLVRPTRKVRFSVTSPAQSAPFGHVAVASPVQSAVFRESETPECAFP